MTGSRTKTDASYFHKVVDCQWACPAHTPVPEYIRLIAEGKYDDAYMINRDSNVFPGVLGRVCDRPCEPACRRGRTEAEPVAICRLKRVAADMRGDILPRLDKVPSKKNGKRVAIIGSGPASLTVANDLLPLGYHIDMFEKDRLPGGAMRSSVPLFRLPAQVLDDEIAMVVDRGVNLQLQKPVTSMQALLAAGYDSVFVGSGAPMGRDLKIPGREAADQYVHIGLKWLGDIAFAHRKSISGRVLVIGGGNTAMDCCRTAKRVGAVSVDVVAPESFDEMLASPWEKQESLEEGVQFHNHLLPKAFLVENNKLVGVQFQALKQAYNAAKQWAPVPSGDADVTIACDEVILAVGQATAFPFIERNIGINFEAGRDLAIVDKKSFQSTHEQVFFGGDAAFGPKNIIWAVAHGHDAAWSMDAYMRGQSLMQRPLPGMTLKSQKMGLHEWSYDNAHSAATRFIVPHVALKERFTELSKEVELGFSPEQAAKEAARCLNCDVQTVFSEPQCIECDACVDICPVQCLTITAPLPVPDLLQQLNAPALNYPEQDLFLSDPLKDTGRLMVKDEDLCLHCGLCAERCPTGAWDMQKSSLKMPRAGVMA